MFNNIVLDIFTGLIFIFLLYSLLATILQEIVARTFNLRSKLLLNAIRIMLQDRNQESDENDNPLFKTVTRFFNSFYLSISRYFNPLPPGKFIKAFYKHPSIKYLGESSWQSKPSYLEPSNFSATIMKLLRGSDYNGSEPQMNAIYRSLFNAGQNNVMVETGTETITAEIEPETLQQIRQLYIDAKKDADRFKTLLEDWFNQTMDRASGWYKRQTQWILFFIGLTIAFTFNVDTIAIYRLLAKDKTARQNLIQLVISSKPAMDSLNKKLKPVISKDSSFQKSIPVILKAANGRDSTVYDTVWKYSETKTINLTDKELANAYQLVQSDIDKASSIAALGRPDEDSCRRCGVLVDSLKKSTNEVTSKAIKDSIDYYNRTFQCAGNPYQGKGIERLLGWILTALAISLGAPFWFDLLNKIIQLRGTGPKPKTADGDTATTNSGNKNTGDPGSSPVQRVG